MGSIREAPVKVGVKTASALAGLIAYSRGMPAAMAVECARRAVPTEVRPNFETAEKYLEQKASRAAP